MNKKVNCTDLIRQLTAKGIPNDKILEQVQKYSPKPKNWRITIIEYIQGKMKKEYASNCIKKKTNKRKIKNCQYPGCGKEYIGHPITKFCDYHQNVKNRKSEKKIVIAEEENRIINHKFKDIFVKTYKCSLCKEKYEINLIPKQYIYPRFCPSHRNKFKRELFLTKKDLK